MNRIQLFLQIRADRGRRVNVGYPSNLHHIAALKLIKPGYWRRDWDPLYGFTHGLANDSGIWYGGLFSISLNRRDSDSRLYIRICRVRMHLKTRWIIANDTKRDASCPRYRSFHQQPYHLMLHIRIFFSQKVQVRASFEFRWLIIVKGELSRKLTALELCKELRCGGRGVVKEGKFTFTHTHWHEYREHYSFPRCGH